MLASAILSVMFVLNSEAQTQQVSTVRLGTLTNVFLTVGDFQEQRVMGLREAHLEADKLAAALRSVGSKPEAEWPEGNWGAASEGFRLSLHFDRVEVTNGEPVVATMLLRNISQRELVFVSTLTEWDFRFSANDGRGAPIRDKHPKCVWASESVRINEK